MPQYKLTYFDGRGRAEIIRLIFVAAGVPFEDVRIPREKWSEVKSSVASPLGQVPVLETEGSTFFQSIAISRYLAKKFGLAGKTDLDQFKADIIVDSVEDTIKPIAQFWREADEAKKAALKKTYVEETLPKLLDSFEELLKTNHNGDGYFVGDSVTWADLHFLSLLSRLELMVGLTDPLQKYPKLKALTERVHGLPKIAEYVAKRPQTTF